jgi:hypothetical protein
VGLSRCTCASCCLAVVSTAEDGACPPDAPLCCADEDNDDDDDDDADEEAESSRFRMLRIESTSVSRRRVSVTCKATAILMIIMNHMAYRLLSQIRHKYRVNGENTSTTKEFKVLGYMLANEEMQSTPCASLDSALCSRQRASAKQKTRPPKSYPHH